MYVLGLDAGGTKTHCVIADADEKVWGEGLSGEGNYQVCGIEKAKESVREAFRQALFAASEALQRPAEEIHGEISCAVLGMAGADAEDDFLILKPAMQEIFDKIPVTVVNDSWIGFYSGRTEGPGVVSVCGTGAAHSGINAKGESLSLRNLDYVTGNAGGGGDLTQKALHFAFRSDEGTAEYSRLEKEVPGLFGAGSMEEVCAILKKGEMPENVSYQLPVLVFRLAKLGDSVCCRLLREMGSEEGHYAAAVVRRLHMEKEDVKAVLIGSLFQTGEPLLIDAYMEELRKAAPGAEAVLPDISPVAGAVRMALKRPGIFFENP